MTNAIFAKTWTIRASAAKAAQRANLTKGTYEIVETDGVFSIIDLTPPPAPVAAAVARRKGGGPKTKFSTIAKPCAVVWAFYGEHRNMPRKDAIAALVAMGVDKGTANIQYGKAARAQW